MGTISSVGLRPPRCYQTIGQTSGVYYPQRYVQYRQPTLSRRMTPTYLHQTPEPVFFCIGLKETSYFIPLAPSPTNYYFFSIEADTTILPARYAFEPSFPEAHGWWFVGLVSS